MNRDEIKRGGIYQIIDNISDHGFAIGDIVIVDTDIEDGCDYAYASLCKRTATTEDRWAVKPEELKPYISKPDTTNEPKWHVMVDDLLDTIEDLHEGMGEIMLKEIKQMYSYPYDWTCKR